MQSQYPVMDAVLIGTKAIRFILFGRIVQALGDFRKGQTQFVIAEGPHLNGSLLREPIGPANIFPQFVPERARHR